jgi:hypothetical protein
VLLRVTGVTRGREGQGWIVQFQGYPKPRGSFGQDVWYNRQRVYLLSIRLLSPTTSCQVKQRCRTEPRIRGISPARIKLSPSGFVATFVAMPPASQAEAYANAHHPHPRKAKPLFNWLSRKLGGRRATLEHLGETDLRRGVTNESEHSLRSYQNNNPYPSMPRRASVVESSFMSRSDSELSRRTDDNASTRPIAPSSPSQSTVLSRTASASASATVSVRSAPLLSPKPLKRNSASTVSLVKTMSTKPTTMSFDSGPPVAHIAQPPVLGSPARAVAHHNPQPQAPPGDDASMLTLASSSKVMRKVPAPPSVKWAPEPNGSELYAPSAMSTRLVIDKDASTRGMRRRGSWSSDVSKWSCGPAVNEANDAILV